MLVRISRVPRTRVVLFGCLALLASACGGSSQPAGGSTDPSGSSDEADAGDSDDGNSGGSDLDASVKHDSGAAGSSKLDGGNKADASASSGSKDSGGPTGIDGGASTKSDGGATTNSDSGSTTQADAAGPAQADVKGCGDTKLLPLKDDMSARGPWDVGIKTVTIGRLTVEVFYPAQPGSTVGKTEATWDLNQFLPKSQRSKVPADHAPPVGVIGGHIYRDVPLDNDHGPYPVVVFIHGTASFRVASASTNAHWASRGIVVLAADYPGLGLSDQLAVTTDCSLPTSGTQNIQSDVSLQLAALKSPSGDAQFLAGHIDAARVGISGHSQGACIAATLSTDSGVHIVISLDGATNTATSSTLESVMYLSGMADQVIGYDSLEIGSFICPTGSISSKSAYQASPGPPKVKKRLVGITGGGHLVPTDLCRKNPQGKIATEESKADGVCGVDSAANGVGLTALSDCGTIDWEKGVGVVNYATAAALEETLLCQDRSKQFASMKTNVPLIGEFLETVK